MKRIYRAVGLTIVVSLAAGCAGRPMGPNVAVMPGSGKNFDAFRQDEYICRQYADQTVGAQAQAANNQAAGSAIIGTLLGAGLGAAIGGGRGAAIGAASGAVAGTAVGAGGSQQAQRGIQYRYDIAYTQCMASRGNQTPGGGYQQGYAPQPGYYPQQQPQYYPQQQPDYPSQPGYYPPQRPGY